MSTREICQIPGNPDIAGIGVRTAVYIQACLAALNSISTAYLRKSVMASEAAAIEHSSDTTLGFIRALISNPPFERPEHYQAFLRDNRDYLDIVKVLERGLFMVGLAVIVSAFIEATSTGLTPYHALIILNLSQLNCWSGMTLLFKGRGYAPNKRGPKYSRFTKESLVMSIPWILQSTAMSAFGVYFWSDMKPFLKYAVEAKEKCRPLTFFWLFRPIEVPNNTVQLYSRAFYAISATPIVGLYFYVYISLLATLATSLVITIPITVVSVVGAALFILLVYVVIFIFRLLYCPVIKPIIVCIIRPLSRIPLIQEAVSATGGLALRILLPVYRHINSFTAPFLDGLTLDKVLDNAFRILVEISSCAPHAYTIVSTELIIRLNSPNVEPSVETRWTYGQTLAMFTALVSLALYSHEVGKLVMRRRRNFMESAQEGRGGHPTGNSQRQTPKLPSRLLMEVSTQTETNRPQVGHNETYTMVSTRAPC